jgi:predicted transcriptional regulator
LSHQNLDREEAKVTETEDLLFELSHEKRLAILEILERRAARLSDIAVHSKISPPEVSRHLGRLARHSLVGRGSNGEYGLTPYGRLVVRGLPSFKFLFRHRDFLLTHDLSALPGPFLNRLAELSELEVGSSFTDTLRHVERVLHEADEFAWFLSDQAMLTSTTLVDAARRSGVAVRAIVPRSLLPPAAHPGAPRRPSGVVEIRVVPEVRVGIAMNEQIAGVSFANLGGRIDQSEGFRGSSAEFRGWCRDLFLHYWNIGRPARLELEISRA